MSRVHTRPHPAVREDIRGKQMPPPDREMREASAKEYRDQFRRKNRKERRAVLAEIRKVERGDYS